MTQRKTNCHVNDNGIEILSCVYEWWSGILGLTSTKLSLQDKSLSQINSFHDFTNISGVISTVNVILYVGIKRGVLIMQQTETYYTDLTFGICCSLLIYIFIPLQSLDRTIVNFLQLNHTDQWKFRLKFSRTCQVKSNKYSFLIARKKLFLGLVRFIWS